MYFTLSSCGSKNNVVNDQISKNLDSSLNSDANDNSSLDTFGNNREENINLKSFRPVVTFCENYSRGKEIGEKDTFIVADFPKNVTVVLDTRPIHKILGVYKVGIKIFQILSSTENNIDFIEFNVQPQWDVINFDNITFNNPGKYKVVFLKSDSSEIAEGQIILKYK